MDLCTQCGHELGIGRFCTNCGRPVDQPHSAPAGDLDTWRTDTAERPRVATPIEPLPVPERPEPPRFPLYADDEPPDASPTDRVAPVVLPPPPPAVDRSARTGTRATPGWLPWLVGFGLMVLVAGFGAWLLFGGSDPETAQEPPPASDPTDEEEPAEVEPSSPKPSPTRTSDAEPFVGDLAPFASVSAPPSAPPGQGADGEVVRYVAGNLVDGVPETAWRMPGDGTGRSITFRFDEPATLTEVGLVNGYAKVARDRRGMLDWYHGNRRVAAVEWTFDDGTVVTQRLSDTTLIQMTRVAKVRTESVTVRLLRVTPPGGGRTSRNYTAISEVSFLGTLSP
ncbi:MAG: NADase-type glycan-binding domain-containing protein [Nocardioides sp.]